MRLSQHYNTQLKRARVQMAQLRYSATASQTDLSVFHTATSAAQTDAVVVMTEAAMRTRNQLMDESVSTLTHANRQLDRSLRECRQQ